MLKVPDSSVHMLWRWPIPLGVIVLCCGVNPFVSPTCVRMTLGWPLFQLFWPQHGEDLIYGNLQVSLKKSSSASVPPFGNVSMLEVQLKVFNKDKVMTVQGKGVAMQ